MTHTQWECGESLTIHNATKEQLKFMVKDRDETIKKMWKELEDNKNTLDRFVSHYSKMRTLMMWKKDFKNERDWISICEALDLPDETAEVEMLVSVCVSKYKEENSLCEK